MRVVFSCRVPLIVTVQGAAEGAGSSFALPQKTVRYMAVTGRCAFVKSASPSSTEAKFLLKKFGGTIVKDYASAHTRG